MFSMKPLQMTQQWLWEGWLFKSPCICLPVGMNSFTMFKKAPTNRVFDTESLVCISNENNSLFPIYCDWLSKIH